MRTVGSAFGPLAIPVRPTRVITLDGGAGPALDAGITPIATADGKNTTDLTPAELAAVAALPTVAGADGWDYEKIASLEPDLLIGYVRGGTTDELSAEKKAEWQKLSEIAPTVFIRSNGSGQAKDAAVQIADALGAGDQAHADRAAYEKKAAAIKQKYAAVLAQHKFAAVDAYEGEVTVYTSASWIGDIQADAGLPTVTAAAGVTDKNGVVLSAEQVNRINDATIIFTENTAPNVPGPGAVELTQMPTFNQLNAVQGKHVVGLEHFFAERYSTALLVLDQIDSYLAKDHHVTAA